MRPELANLNLYQVAERLMYSAVRLKPDHDGLELVLKQTDRESIFLPPGISTVVAALQVDPELSPYRWGRSASDT